MNKNFKSKFIEINNIFKVKDPENLKQVYIWVVTQDKKIIIVSKDGVKWQMPGGKPNSGETILETAKRELWEESGLNLSEKELTVDLKLFGYYDIQEFDDDILVDKFYQLRCFVELYKTSKDLQLQPKEDMSQNSNDIIKFVKFVEPEELLKLIPWMKNAEEFTYIDNFLKK